MPKGITPLQVAMHEAGHLLVQISDPEGHWVEEVWILREGQGDFLGQVVSPARWNRNVAEFASKAAGDTEPLLARLRENAEADILVSLAGPIAEARWRNNSWIGVALSGSMIARDCLAGNTPEGSDLAKVKVRLDWLYGSPTVRDFAAAWDAATARVRQLWPIITRVGRDLAIRRTFSADDVGALRAELRSRADSV